MDWNGARVEARHHHMSRVLSAQHTYATDFFLKLWYDSIVKYILDTFLHKMLARAVKNAHDHIFTLWQINGWFRQYWLLPG